jgi:hypothetical protein
MMPTATRLFTYRGIEVGLIDMDIYTYIHIYIYTYIHIYIYRYIDIEWVKFIFGVRMYQYRLLPYLSNWDLRFFGGFF